MLACSSTENIPVKELCGQLVTGNEIISPDPHNAGIYEEKFESYKQLYPSLRQFWKK
jgi:sugar (pentulose or hexulose) kinase